MNDEDSNDDDSCDNADDAGSENKIFNEENQEMCNVFIKIELLMQIRSNYSACSFSPL